MVIYRFLVLYTNMLNTLLITQLVNARILVPRGSALMLNPRWEIHAQINRAVWGLFTDHYDWCDSGSREQVFCLLHAIDEPPGCTKCGKFVTFNLHRNRYNLHCSQGCVHSSVGGVKISDASTTFLYPSGVPSKNSNTDSGSISSATPTRM